MPLKPADPVNPTLDPSVTNRCDSLPNTRMAPARPHMAPLNVRAATMVRFTGIPAYRAAALEWPTARSR